jgi:hypothetical protein
VKKTLLECGHFLTETHIVCRSFVKATTIIVGYFGKEERRFQSLSLFDHKEHLLKFHGLNIFSQAMVVIISKLPGFSSKPAYTCDWAYSRVAFLSSATRRHFSNDPRNRNNGIHDVSDPHVTISMHQSHTLAVQRRLATIT